jgi:hypothetical protein
LVKAIFILTIQLYKEEDVLQLSFIVLILIVKSVVESSSNLKIFGI